MGFLGNRIIAGSVIAMAILKPVALIRESVPANITQLGRSARDAKRDFTGIL